MRRLRPLSSPHYFGTVALGLAVLSRVFVFFFQAEDGIRDSSVTGVQTCALPIYSVLQLIIRTSTDLPPDVRAAMKTSLDAEPAGTRASQALTIIAQNIDLASNNERSEERRVGKGVDLGGRRIIKKKK